MVNLEFEFLHPAEQLLRCLGVAKARHLVECRVCFRSAIYGVFVGTTVYVILKVHEITEEWN